MKQQDLKEIEAYATVKCSKVDNHVGITIKDKTPDETVYFDDGSKIDKYSTILLIGSWGTMDSSLSSTPYPGSETIWPSDFYVKLCVRADYYQYINNYFKYTRLDTGYGTLVDCFENGYRNLKITPVVLGGWQNPDGSYGSDDFIIYPRTIANPTIGTLYSKSTNNPKYYATGTGAGRIEVRVSVEWTHNGTQWYTSEFSIEDGW